MESTGERMEVSYGSLDERRGGSSRWGDTNDNPTAHHRWRANSRGLISGL